MSFDLDFDNDVCLCIICKIGSRVDTETREFQIYFLNGSMYAYNAYIIGKTNVKKIKINHFNIVVHD